MLRSRFLSSFLEFLLAVSKKKLKMSQPIRGQGGHLVFSISQKNTNFVEDVEILLHVKFRWILCSSFKGEVENVFANQRQGRPSCFFIGLKNTNLVEDVEILLSVEFHWIPFSSFRGEVENVSANQRPGRPSCFSDWPQKHKLTSRHRYFSHIATWKQEIINLWKFKWGGRIDPRSSCSASQELNHSATAAPFYLALRLSCYIQNIAISLTLTWILANTPRYVSYSCLWNPPPPANICTMLDPTNTNLYIGTYQDMCHTVVWTYHQYTCMYNATPIILTWILTNTPWYVSYSCLWTFGFSGISNGISVFPPGSLPGFAISRV